MSIKKLFLALLLTSFNFSTASAFAKQLISINESFAFNPVNWHLTLATGGFSIINETTKNQFVQIVLNTGSVGVYKLVNDELSCKSSLGGSSVNNSTVCELAPGERLQIDLDYEPMTDATGTYQIEMAK